MKKAVRKLISIVLTMMILFSIGSFTLPVQAKKPTAINEGKYGSFTYFILTDEVIIYDCDKDISDSVTIPSKINGYPVTRIYSSTFEDCTLITSITIPNSVKQIEMFAFSNCERLTSITIPESVESVESPLFDGCSSLSSIKVSTSNPNYDSRNNCNAIIDSNSNELISGCKNTTIPKSVTSIGEDAFYRCTGLTSITIPDSVTSIGGNAFYECSGLTNLTIPNNVKSIGYWAFSGCTGLQNVSIGNGTSSIDRGAFSSCSNLSIIKVSTNNPYFDSRNNCNAIIDSDSNELLFGCKSTIIPNSVTSIGEVSFLGSDLTNLTIPDSVTALAMMRLIIAKV